MAQDNGFLIVMAIVFALLIWLALREIMTWYWKINRIVDLLEKIEGHLRRDGEQNAPQVEDGNVQGQRQDDIQNKRKNPLLR